MNIFTKSLLAIGVLGLGATVAAPAFAQDVQAYASGSATIVLMNGASQSIGAEIGAPSGVGFAGGAAAADGELVVTPNSAFGGAIDLSGFTAFLGDINVAPGTATETPSVNASVEAAVATIISQKDAGTTQYLNSTADAASVVRAWQSGLD
jgi:hypothetical protein